jgi:hypothetical protein
MQFGLRMPCLITECYYLIKPVSCARCWSRWRVVLNNPSVVMFSGASLASLMLLCLYSCRACAAG